MSKEYYFDSKRYFGELSHYFAFSFVDIFGGRVCFWLDKDEETGKDRLVHAFVEVVPCLYADASGFFRNIGEIQGYFSYNDVRIQTFDSIEDAKSFLNMIRVRFTDVQDKRNVREYLKNYMPVFSVKCDDNVCVCGLLQVTPDNNRVLNRNKVFFVDFDVSKCEFSNFVKGEGVHSIDRYHFANSVIDFLDFKENPRWFFRRW